MLAGMVGDDVIQLGPVGVSTAQLGFHILLGDPPDDGLPADTLHIDVYEGDITCGPGTKGCVLATLLAMPGRCSTVSNRPGSRSLDVLVGDHPGDLFTTGVSDAHYALFDCGENHIGREDYLVPFPERGPGRKRRRTRVGESGRRRETPLFSVSWRNTRILRFRLIFSANGFRDEAVNHLDGLGADFDGFATDHVGLGQSRARLWVADHKTSRREGRAGRGRTRGRLGWRPRACRAEMGGGVGF